MDCNELMTGDYVRHKRTKDIIWIFEIDADRNVINNESDGYGSERNISIDDIEPIPLTSEIMKEFGFTLYEDTYRWHYPCFSGDCNLWLEESRIGAKCYMLEGFPPYKVKYVHELQHLLTMLNIKRIHYKPI